MTLASNSSMGQRAFPVYPRLDRYFAAPSAEAARHRLTQCLLRGDGPAVLLGAAGSGKTMLLEVIANELASTLTVVQIAGAQLCTRRALLQSILHGLGASYRDREEGELRLSLAEELSDTTTAPEGVALLVDEAQSLPVRLLEELRLLANMAIHGTPRLRLLLAGTHSLDETFTVPELTAFNQRLAARCYLDPLRREETTQYVRAHIAAAGGDPDALFTTDAFEAVQLASDGLPRLINQVCDRALVLAVENQQEMITGASIQEAWSDLHQLSAPWQAPASASIAASRSNDTSGDSLESVLEFGVLDEVLDEDLQLSSSNSNSNTMKSLSEEPLDTAVWNADEGLRHLPTRTSELDEIDDLDDLDDGDTQLDLEPDELEMAHVDNAKVRAEIEDIEADEEDCISYAFPVNPQPLTTTTDDEKKLGAPAKSYEDNSDISEDSSSGEEEQNDETLAKDPFDEPFDEEEIVLDRFADLHTVMPAATIVTNHSELEFGRMFEALTPAVEGLLQEVTDRLAPPAPKAGFAVVDLEEEADLSASVDEVNDPIDEADSTDSEPVLIVEEDLPLASVATPASRKDYAQLFAGLRQG